MSGPEKELGKLIAVYGIAPVYLQRAVFIVVLSFLFFLAMMFAYYIRQNIGYFLLASAFLVLYLVTLFSWVIQRRTVIEIREHGLNYKGLSALWNEIELVNDDGTIVMQDSASITIPKTINDRDALINLIRQKAMVG